MLLLLSLFCSPSCLTTCTALLTLFHLPSSPIMPSPSGSCSSPQSSASRRTSSDFSWNLGGYSTSPSSVASSPSDDEGADWTRLERQTNEFVHRLLRKEKESEVALGAWRIRCQTLEEEVSRLALLLDKVEKERDEARREAKEACAHKATVVEQVQVRFALASVPSLADRDTRTPRLISRRLLTVNNCRPAPPPRRRLARKSTRPSPCQSKLLRPATPCICSATVMFLAAATSTATSSQTSKSRRCVAEPRHVP